MTSIYCDSFPSSSLMAVYLGDCQQTVSGLLDTKFELSLISGDPKCHHDAIIRVGTYIGTDNKWNLS